MFQVKIHNSYPQIEGKVEFGIRGQSNETPSVVVKADRDDSTEKEPGDYCHCDPHENTPALTAGRGKEPKGDGEEEKHGTGDVDVLDCNKMDREQRRKEEILANIIEDC